MNKKIVFFLFEMYSYIYNLIFLFLDLMPPFVRKPLFGLMIKKIGKNVFIDYRVYFRYGFSLEIGSNVYINRGCEFFTSYLHKDKKIMLEDNVTIGYNVKFYMAQHDYRFLELPDVAESIKVEKYVWIGGNVVILPGVTIGEGAVIGAGSVVTKDIPPYSVAVGVPAKVIKNRELAKSSKK